MPIVLILPFPHSGCGIRGGRQRWWRGNAHDHCGFLQSRYRLRHTFYFTGPSTPHLWRAFQFHFHPSGTHTLEEITESLAKPSWSVCAAFCPPLCPQVSVKSAGPTTAREQVPLPPSCCARGWLASPARNRSSTHTEMEPPGINRGGDGPKGLGGTEASSCFQKVD